MTHFVEWHRQNSCDANMPLINHNVCMCVYVMCARENVWVVRVIGCLRACMFALVNLERRQRVSTKVNRSNSHLCKLPERHGGCSHTDLGGPVCNTCK